MTDILDTPTQTEAPPLRYSRLWRRIVASIIDGVIASGFNLLTKFVVIRFSPLLILVNIAALAFALFMYVFLVARFGATPGKMIMRMRIVQLNGQPATWGNAILRYIVNFAFLSSVTIPYLITYVYPTVNPDEWQWYYIPLVDRQISTPTIALHIWNIISLITIAINKQRRAPHDFIAGTVVILTRKNPLPPNVIS